MSTDKYSWSCMSNAGKKIDWFSILKPPKINDAINGLVYYYYDSEMDANGAQSMRKFNDISSKENAIFYTLDQLNQLDPTNEKEEEYVALFYNDQMDDTSFSGYGHMKGALCFYNNSGFFLTHTVPQYLRELFFIDYADNGISKGQQFFCVTIQKPGLETLAEHLFISRPKLKKDLCHVHTKFSDESVYLHMVYAEKYEDKDITRSLMFESLNGLKVNVFTQSIKHKENLWLQVKKAYPDIVFEVSSFWNDQVKIKEQVPGLKVVTETKLKNRQKWAPGKEHSKYAFNSNINCFGDVNYTDLVKPRSGGIDVFENMNLNKAVRNQFYFKTL